MNYHVALTSVLPNDDPKKFTLNTQNSIESTMLRCWEVEPTSKRIVEDISQFDQVIQKIIDASGTLVSDEALRQGRRSLDSNDTKDPNYLSTKNKDLKNKRKNHQRIETVSKERPYHPDCEEAAKIFKGETNVNFFEHIRVDDSFYERENEDSDDESV